jgi:hypothetical protein
MNLQGGKLEFSAQNDAGAEFVYGSIGMTIRDSSANEDGSLEIRVGHAGTESTVEYMRIGTTNQAIYLNPGAVNIDTQISSENVTAMLKVDAGNDIIGIGAAPSSTLGMLQVNVGNSTQTALTLISTDADGTAAPTLQLFRNSASPIIGDVIGRIEFAGEDDGGSLSTYTEIDSTIRDTSAGGENGDIRLRVRKSGTLRTMLRARESEVVINEDSVDCNFRVESDSNTEMFRVDAGLNKVSVGAAPASGGATFQVPNNTMSSYCNVNAVRSDGVATQIMVNEDCQGQMWVNDSATNWNLDLPETTGKGQWFQFMGTGGDITIDPNPSGVGSRTLNGGTAAITRSANYEIYTVMCYDTDKWAVSRSQAA